MINFNILFYFPAAGSIPLSYSYSHPNSLKNNKHKKIKKSKVNNKLKLSFIFGLLLDQSPNNLKASAGILISDLVLPLPPII